jgi:glutamate---cysteine ligase / carboxylate-amine ligase
VRRLGVEEELLLVDPETGVPTAVSSTLLHIASAESSVESDEVGTIGAELQQQQIEVDTQATRSLAELTDQLSSVRRRVADLAEQAGARVAALGTSPLPVTPKTTPASRYLTMVDRFGLTTAEQLTCGCHVHVEVASEAEGVGVLDRIRVWLPPLLALSVNSPFWQGEDTRYASFRSQAWNRWPSAGPAPVWGSPAAYHRELDRMVSSGVLLDRHMAYFDARLSDRYPTVEVRVADVCLDLADTILIAGLVRALVETAAAEWADGVPAPDISTGLLRLATWRAGRSGLGGELVDPLTALPRSAYAVVEQVLEHAAGALRDSGDEDLVTRSWRDLRRRGTGADVQRRIWHASGDLSAVVRKAVERTVSSTD